MDRQALRKLLVARRAQGDPEGHGLQRPAGRGRRALGLSQYQMDHLLQRAMGTYGRFERGDLPSPPRDLLTDVATILGFGEQEWTALWLYSRGHVPPAPLRPEDGLRVPDVWQRAVNRIGEMAFISNFRWDVLGYNKAFAAMFPSGTVPQNSMRWMLLCPEARTVSLLDWKRSWAPALMGQLRAACAAYPQDETLCRLEHDVKKDPETGPLYARLAEVRVHPDGDERPLHHARLGAGMVTLTAAAPCSVPGARLIIALFNPASC
ncbi:XRE family transcriptional regulator [Streptomyces sp. NPDC001852]|uniref:MmyB family transcriptional regulator n=1 Tax=Streptomyces sp. NPDC001852 TaxID=3364619 RepID=UPI0036A87D62